MTRAESDWSRLALMSVRAKAQRESFLKYLWVAHVKDEFDVALPFQTQFEFSSMTQSVSSNTTKWSVWPSKQPSVVPSGQNTPPRSSFLETQTWITVQCMPGWVWRLERELNGWGFCCLRMKTTDETWNMSHTRRKRNGRFQLRFSW